MSDKKDPDMTMSSSQISVTSNSCKNSQNNLRCVSNNKVGEMCLNIKCAQKNVFQCLEIGCQCRANHKKCQKGDSDDVISYVFSKIHNTKKLNDAIEIMITQKINQLNALKPVLLKEVDQRYKYTDMHELERKFLGMVKGDVKLSELTPPESKQIWESANLINTNKRTDIFDRLIKHVNQLSSNITSQVNTLKNSINNELLVQQKYLKMIPEPIASKQLEPKCMALAYQIIKNSMICQTEQLSEMLVKMFRKKITKIECIYTASKNDFSISKFYTQCGSVPNTVILCATNKDKIIGGYTPLLHDHQQTGNRNGTDTSGQSFLFSLTDGEKFILKEKDQALYRYTQKNLIRFGNSAELQICDKANTSNCYTQVNCGAYYCPAYSVNDKAAWLKLNGNETQTFTLKEWEVWKVQF